MKKFANAPKFFEYVRTQPSDKLIVVFYELENKKMMKLSALAKVFCNPDNIASLYRKVLRPKPPVGPICVFDHEPKE